MFDRVLSAGTCLLAAVGTAACGDSDSGPGTKETVTVTAEQTAAEQTAAQQSTVAPPRAEPSQQWAMPDLVGSDLQQAQDQVQALTGSAVFYTSSHDLSGQDRNQVVDANWKVCTQNVAPGSPVAAGAEIDFGVVKLAESCP